MDYRTVPATREGLQQALDTEHAEWAAQTRAEITKLQEKLETRKPAVADVAKGFFRFGSHWVQVKSKLKTTWDVILHATVFANEVGETVYVRLNSVFGWLAIHPTATPDATLWDAHEQATAPARNEESRARGYRDPFYVKEDALPFDGWQAHYAGSRERMRMYLLLDKARDLTEARK